MARREQIAATVLLIESSVSISGLTVFIPIHIKASTLQILQYKTPGSSYDIPALAGRTGFMLLVYIDPANLPLLKATCQ